MKHCTIDGCHRPIQGRGLCGPHYSTWHRSQRRYTVECAACGQTAAVARPHMLYCSRACSNRVKQAVMTAAASKSRTRRRLQRSLPVLYTGPRRQPPPIVWKKTARRLTSGQCRVCSEWFVSFETGVTCSPQCQHTYQAQLRRLAKDRRRALKKLAFVEKVIRKQVYQRDGYRCHLCRRKTDPTKQVPHPRAPTLDHVIPLAHGGKHEPTNCRTACFLCNCLKGDRGGGEQLLLIA